MLRQAANPPRWMCRRMAPRCLSRWKLQPKSAVPPGYPLKVNDKLYESDVLVRKVRCLNHCTARRKCCKATATWIARACSTTLPKDLFKGWVRFRGFCDSSTPPLLQDSTVVSAEMSALFFLDFLTILAGRSWGNTALMYFVGCVQG